ncbi:MAG: hypothetical protein QG608_3800 [Actinomycetota bacterium]|nr:hypothetical protein [Actinomycetota bacterium]
MTITDTVKGSGSATSLLRELADSRTTGLATLPKLSDDDATTVTAIQLREVIERLVTAGRPAPGDPPIEIAKGRGGDVTCLIDDLHHLGTPR